MKKAFNLKFLALSALLMLGNVAANASARDYVKGPADGTAVGATIKIGDQVGLVTYRVTGWDDTNDFYEVSITGLDADGLDALAAARKGGNKVTLRIPVSFEEKFGENKYKYAVKKIEDGLVGTTKQSFYGLVEVDTLEFIDGASGYNGVSLDKFFYTVGTKSFYGCTNMKKLVFTKNCTSIGTYAFQNSAIRTFVIPEECATVGEYAFYNCKYLKTVSVASGNTAMTTLGNHVFGNSSLETLDLSNAQNLATITGEPFMYDLSVINDVLTTVKVAKKLTTIEHAFANCTALEKIEGFGNTAVTSIAKHGGKEAFENCRSLKYLDIPAAATISNAPFTGCVSLDSLTLAANYHATIGDGIATYNLFGIVDKNNAKYDAASQGALKVIHCLGAFSGTFANNSFVGVTGLKKINFTKGLVAQSLSSTHYAATINAAFTDVTSLEEVLINCVEVKANDAKDVTIGANAFKNTGIKALLIPSVKFATKDDNKFVIADGAFSECAALAKVEFAKSGVSYLKKGVVDIQAKAFINNPVLAEVAFGQISNGSSNGNIDGTFKIADNAFAEGNVKLAKVTFENINSMPMASANGAKSVFTIGYPTATAANVFGDGEHLETVTFGLINVYDFDIDEQAFASTGLKEIKFGQISSSNNNNSTFDIAKSAFFGGDKVGKIVAFEEILEKGTGSMTVTIDGAAFAADSLKSVSFKDIEANFTVKNDGGTPKVGAFEGKNLQSVVFGNITASCNEATDGNRVFTLEENAFKGGDVAAKTVTIGTIKDFIHSSNAANDKILTATIGKNAFAADSLKEVTIGDMVAASVTIDDAAFQGKNLQKVKLNNITASRKSNAIVVIGDNAFQGGEVADKTVEVGNIVNATAPLTTTTSATIKENAFAAKLLKSVTIGDMTAKSITISGNNAFANLSALTDDAMAETVTIGEMGAINIGGNNVFQGPTAAGSQFDVTIAKITGSAVIPANTFVAPADGKSSYTITGDVDAVVSYSVVSGAFVGSRKYVKGSPKGNTTNVLIGGDYNKTFTTGVFTNVDSLTIVGTVNAGTDLNRFMGVRIATIGKIPATGAFGGGAANLEAITFTGGVEKAGAITNFTSPVLRKIEFANVEKADTFVVAGAVAANAFTAAATDAATNNEQITVIYREEQTREAEVIFDRQAFATAAGTAVATLYTSSWAKANTFEAKDVELGTQCVFRMGYSESEVAPGEDIIAKVTKLTTYGYAKLYIPKGVNMMYKVPAKYDKDSDKNGVQLYYGRIDNSNNKIYMYNLPVIDDYYWIDATDVDQAFVLRTTLALEDAEKITAEPVTAEDLATFAAGDPSDYYFFDANLAKQNQLRYNTAEIANQELRNNPEFEGRDVYVMANPATQGFKFAKFKKDATYTKATGDHEVGDLRWLSAKSLYIVGKKQVAGAPELEVVFEGDENFDANLTGIDEVKAADKNSDAIYNLQGVRVNKAQKGLYIINGKKFVVK